PDRGHIHRFEQQPLIQCAVAKKANRYLSSFTTLGGQGCACRNCHTPADDGIRAQVARIWIGNVHRTAFSMTVAPSLTEQFREHLIGSCALCQAMTMPSMRTGDVIIP